MMEMRIKEDILEAVIDIVDSAYMRSYLLEKRNEITISEYVELIAAAPHSLPQKASLLSDLLKIPMSAEDFQYVKRSLRMVETALERLYSVDRTKTILLLNCIDIEKGEPCLLEAVPVLSYQGALQYIRQNYVNDTDDDFTLDDRECDFYFRLDFYDIQESETLEQQYCYILTPGGEVQYFRNDLDGKKREHKIGEPKSTLFYRHGKEAEYAMTPYQPGDILYVNCRPYTLPSYCLIYRINPDMPRDCCSLRCFYPAFDGVIGEGALKHGHFSTMASDYYTDCFVSPLYRAELYTGELPESCSFMKQVSSILKEYPELGKDIDSLMWKYGEDFPVHSGSAYKSIHGITAEGWEKITNHCLEYARNQKLRNRS
ncbi:MAG: hypothetical protein LIP12_13995 [Clostridiales bacterium]|nr:hypothetical protein [Clostridiales bacterium]